MLPVIVQNAYFFHPLKIPGYQAEAEKCFAAEVFPEDIAKQLPVENPSSAMESLCGLDIDLLIKIGSGFYCGQLLYPELIKSLQQLKIGEISMLTQGIDDDPVPGISTFEELVKYIHENYSVQPEFHAKIDPEIKFGTNEVKMNLAYTHTHFVLPGRDSKYNRSVFLSAKFDDPAKSCIGICPLQNFYPDVIFEDELFLFEMLPKLQRLFGEIREHRSLRDAKEIINELNNEYVDYIDPLLKLVGISLVQVEIKDNKSNLEYKIPVESYQDVLGVMKNHDRLVFPAVQALHDGRRIELELGVQNKDFNLTSHAIYVRNLDERGTLEKVMESGIKLVS